MDEPTRTEALSPKDPKLPAFRAAATGNRTEQHRTSSPVPEQPNRLS